MSTADQLEEAAQKLIEEANTESAAALEEYEEDCFSVRFRLLENGTYRSSILQDALNELRAAYDARVLRIQKDLDESLEALYAESQQPSVPGTGGTDGEDPDGGSDGGTDGGNTGGGTDGEDPDGGSDGGNTGGGTDGEDPDGGSDGGNTGGGTDGEDPDGGQTPEAPYEVDYTLSMRDRYIAVKNYYLSIPDVAEALALLREDEVAKDYLGTYYNYVEQLLIMMQ